MNYHYQHIPNNIQDDSKMMEVEEDEVREMDPLTIERKVTKALMHKAKEWSTLRDVLQTRKVTKNQCCNSLLDYLFSPTGKELCEKMVAVTKEDHKKHDGEPPKKKEDPICFSIPVTIKGFYVV